MYLGKRYALLDHVSGIGDYGLRCETSSLINALCRLLPFGRIELLPLKWRDNGENLELCIFWPLASENGINDLCPIARLINGDNYFHGLGSCVLDEYCSLLGIGCVLCRHLLLSDDFDRTRRVRCHPFCNTAEKEFFKPFAAVRANNN